MSLHRSDTDNRIGVSESIQAQERDKLRQLQAMGKIDPPTILSPAASDIGPQNDDSIKEEDDSDANDTAKEESDCNINDAAKEENNSNSINIADGEATGLSNPSPNTAGLLNLSPNTAGTAGTAASAAAPLLSTSSLSAPSCAKHLTLKELYGMLCWLQISDNRRLWQSRPLDACTQATRECQHLLDANPRALTVTLDELNMTRLQILENHQDVAENVPQDLRLFPGGPLFVIFNHAVAGQPADAEPVPSEMCSLIMANATGALKKQRQMMPQQQQQLTVAEAMSTGQHLGDSANTNISGSGSVNSRSRSPSGTVEKGANSGGGGPSRHGMHRVSSGMLPCEHPFMQRARRLTPAEVRQMKDELAVRREISLRDAVLLADWTALRRRELELRERQIRELVREAQDDSVESLVRFEEFMRKIYDEQP
ncbi:hypothetical protein LPJ66_001614 [Kickxella alabastrina]|uniref:Uncharacterized protein n=1 Tax=Kickxella alabastrina TaxID=61397 RepID=A0ACC1ISQ3_9FUNG|nr:hypothetical protein LPJ66_001614 [Kickxella alabastrina]